MDVQEIRRLNLQYIIDTKFNGRLAAFARNVDKDSSYISRCLYPSEKKYSKKIGEKVAAEFCLALSLPRTWLDTPHWGEIREETEDSIAKPYPSEAKLRLATHTQILQVPIALWSEYCENANSIIKKEMDNMTISKDYQVSSELFALDIDNNSFKEFPRGTRILIDPTIKNPVKGNTVLLSINDEMATLVRWCPGFGALQIQPLESGHPESISLEGKNYTVLGIAIKAETFRML